VNHQSFDIMALSLSGSPPRRQLLRGLASIGFGLCLGVAPLSGITEAKKKRRHKKKRKSNRPKPMTPKPNALGCFNVGQPCNGDSATCCSGICEGNAPQKGETDRSRCVAHDAGICTPGSNACTGEGLGLCNPSNSDCTCLRTTGNATFCGDAGNGVDLSTLCRDCRQDTDCEAEFGPGAACVIFDGICSDVCPDPGTACVSACLDGDM
jgi:hypothetical protein